MTQRSTKPKIGAKMPDGTVYAGNSPETNKPMYVIPANGSLGMTFNEAMAYAQWANAQSIYGHNDWHVPTKSELNELFNNRAAVGGFNVSGSHPVGWYWSATPYTWSAWGQRFSDGCQCNPDKGNYLSVRLVRSDARRGMRGEETIEPRMRAVLPKVT
jgi:Protein of unknown function (DUF1566)